MTDNHLHFHCFCGWTGTDHSLPADEWRCPRCGDALGATAVMAEEVAVDERPEFVLSPSQRRHTWPRDFWVGIMRRVLDDELAISPRELARGVLPYVPAADLVPPPAPILNVTTFENGNLVIRHIPAPLNRPPSKSLPPPKARRGRPRGNPDWPANRATRDRIVNAMITLLEREHSITREDVMLHLGWHGDPSQMTRLVRKYREADGETTWEGLQAEAKRRLEEKRRSPTPPNCC